MTTALSQPKARTQENVITLLVYNSLNSIHLGRYTGLRLTWLETL